MFAPSRRRRGLSKDRDIHLVLNNYATHKHEKVRNWIERRKRFCLHFTPTSASWANLVERFFALLTEKRSAAPRSRPCRNSRNACGST